MGSRPAGQAETGAVRHPDGGDWGVDAVVRITRDQRRVGRCVAVVVAAGPGRPRARQAPGDLTGQRAEEFRPADAVPEADGAVRRLVGSGGPPGVLPAVSQQVQPDRAVLVGVGEEVEWSVTDRVEGGPAMCPADGMEGAASDGEAAPRHLSRWCPRPGRGDEADRGAAATVADL